jgi:branched-chain amino acid aminotransferase
MAGAEPSSPMRLWAAEPAAPRALALPRPVRDLHELLDGCPLGIYEALRTFGRTRFLRLEDHFDRADRSIEALESPGEPTRLDRLAVRRTLDAAVRAFGQGDARVRIDVLARSAPELGSAERTLVSLAPLPALPPVLFERGVAVGVARGLVRARPKVKEARWVVERRAAEQAGDGLYEHVLVDSTRRMLECTSANLYLARGGELHTAGSGVLEGITRRFVLEIAASLAVPIVLEAVALPRIADFDEAFLSSASRGIVPIVRLAGVQVGKGTPGPLFRRLRAAYEERVLAEARPALE